MHQAVLDFCQSELRRYSGPIARVLDVGSFDMNGTTRILFKPEVHYFGIDVHPGKGVDWVGCAHEFPISEGWDGEPFDALVSTECLEHDKFWEKTLDACVRLVRPGGLVLITCASGNREPHYTECWPDGYYRNLFAQDILPVLEAAEVTVLRAEQVRDGLDLQIVGVRKAGATVPRKGGREEPPWDLLDPGIVEAVRILWDAGFQPTDSGDGSKAGSMECALAYPHIFLVTSPERLISDSRTIAALPWSHFGLGLGEPVVEGSFSPSDGVGIISVLWPVEDAPRWDAPQGGAPAAPGDLEVLEAEHGGLLWVEGDRRLMVERGEDLCSIDDGEPVGLGVRLTVQDQEGIASFILPDEETSRLRDLLGRLSEGKVPPQG